MNKGYEYIKEGQEVEVKEENGHTRIVEYSTNLDEILVKENVIEQIQSDINSSNYALGYQERRKETQKNRFANGFKILTPTLAGTIIISIFVKEFLLLLGLGLLTGTVVTVLEILEKHEIRNTINAINVKISVLRDRLNAEQLELDKLKQEAESKKTERENDTYFQTLNTDELIKLNTLEMLSYQTGYNIQKLYKAYQKGLLRDILGNQYNPSEIEMIESITKKQGPILSRKK